MLHYIELIDKYLNKSISPKERRMLKNWVLKNDDNKTLFKARVKQFNQGTLKHFDSELAYQRFLKATTTKNKLRFPSPKILKYAAVFLMLLALGFLIKNRFYGSTHFSTVETSGNTAVSQEGIQLKLADGTVKVLNTDGEETLTNAQGQIVASKEKNSLRFDAKTAPEESEMALNEIYIPYGQTFKLQLSDGTSVWLNAGTRLRFPQHFMASDKNRLVFLDGEAFFEVTKNKEQPFIVNTQGIDVKVWGTKFNVSSYKTDTFIATTLVEGSVSVNEVDAPENNLMLTPEYQAKYDRFANQFIKRKVNTDLYTAWMQNKLIVDNLKFPDILIKLERKYNVKFINKAKRLNNQVYNGEFDQENIETVLKIMSYSTPFKYDIHDKTITITD